MQLTHSLRSNKTVKPFGTVTNLFQFVKPHSLQAQIKMIATQRVVCTLSLTCYITLDPPCNNKTCFWMHTIVFCGDSDSSCFYKVRYWVMPNHCIYDSVPLAHISIPKLCRCPFYLSTRRELNKTRAERRILAGYPRTSKDTPHHAAEAWLILKRREATKCEDPRDGLNLTASTLQPTRIFLSQPRMVNSSSVLIVEW